MSAPHRSGREINHQENIYAIQSIRTRRGYSRRRRMPSDIPSKNAPSVVSNHEEAIQHAESESWHGEEIHRCNRLTMVAQERNPTLGWLGIFGSLPHPPKHSAFRNVEAQHPELPMNPRRAPSAVLGDHAEDMFSQCLARRLPPNDGVFARKPFPVLLKSGSMPTHRGLWPN